MHGRTRSIPACRNINAASVRHDAFGAVLRILHLHRGFSPGVKEVLEQKTVLTVFYRFEGVETAAN